MHEFSINIFLLIAWFSDNPTTTVVIIACYVVTRLELIVHHFKLLQSEKRKVHVFQIQMKIGCQ